MNIENFLYGLLDNQAQVNFSDVSRNNLPEDIILRVPGIGIKVTIKEGDLGNVKIEVTYSNHFPTRDISSTEFFTAPIAEISKFLKDLSTVLEQKENTHVNTRDNVHCQMIYAILKGESHPLVKKMLPAEITQSQGFEPKTITNYYFEMNNGAVGYINVNNDLKEKSFMHKMDVVASFLEPRDGSLVSVVFQPFIFSMFASEYELLKNNILFKKNPDMTEVLNKMIKNATPEIQNFMMKLKLEDTLPINDIKSQKFKI